MARPIPESWSAATQPAPAIDDRGGLDTPALRRADSAADAAVASRSKTLFARLFRLRGRLSSADSLDPSPSASATASPSSNSRTAADADTAVSVSDREPAPPPHAPVATLFRSLHLRGKSISSDSAMGSDASGSNGPPASDSAAAGRRNGRGRRLIEHNARARAAARVSRAPAARRGVLMESELTKVVPHRYWHSKHAYFVLEEDRLSEADATADAAAGIRIVLRQFRKAEDARANRLELVVSQIALSELDVVRDLRQDPQLRLGLELLFVNAEECPEVSIWSSAMATLAPSPPPPPPPPPSADRDTGLHSLRLAAPDAATHSRWLQALAASISRLIVQSHRHYANASPAAEQRRRVVVPRAVGADTGRLQSTRSMEETGCSPIRAKVAPIHYYAARRADRRDAGAAAKSARADADEDAGGCAVAGNAGDQASPWVRSRPGEATTAAPKRQSEARRRRQCSQEAASGAAAAAIGEDAGYDCESECKHGRGGDCERGGSGDSDNQAQTEDEAEDNQEAEAPEFVVCLTPSDLGSGSTVYQGSEPEQQDPSDADASDDSRSATEHGAPPIGDADGAEPGNNASATAVEKDGHAAPPRRAPLHERGSFGARFLRPEASSLLPFPFPRPQTHTFNAGGQVFTLDTRYRLLKSVGNGAYGAVIAVKDATKDESVAVKKITNIFEDLVDAKRILREVRLLRHFDHKNITRLLDLAPPPSKKRFEDMYIITELMETDLHQVIYSMQPMSDDHVKYFLYQMLCALQHIHSAGVLHRDMKPSNVLLNSNCDLKICDFGLARGGLRTEPGDARARELELTEYVVTRWYRAPEIMLNCLQYTEAIDVWATGCIFAEMLLREPLFPGNDYIHQLKLIVKFLGTPKHEDISFVKNAKALRFLSKLSISKPRKWRDVFAGHDVNPLAVDLLTKMLMFNPAKRISVDDALRHPYLATFFDEVDLKPSTRFDFSFDLPDDRLSRDALVDLLCEDVQHFHPSLASPAPPSVASARGRFFRVGMTASAS